MSLSPLKPVEIPIPDENTVILTEMMYKLALALLVQQSGGRMVFPVKDLDWIKANTLGLESEVITSQHTPEKWFVIKTVLVEKVAESLIIQ